MKILVLSFYYKPDLSAGSFRNVALVEELSKRNNVKLDVVTTRPNRYSSFNLEALDEEVIGNTTIKRLSIPAHKSGMLDQVKAFVSFYKQAISFCKDKKYDLVYASSSRLFTAFLGARLANRLRIPLYLDIRDIFVDTINDVLSKKLLWAAKPVLFAFEKYTFNSATHINLVSKGFEDYFSNRFKCNSYSFFTNGIDSQFLDFEVSRDSTGVKKEIVYAGNIGEGQGLQEIVPKFSTLIGPNYKITIIGDGGRKSLLKDSTALCDNVELRDPIKRDELLEVYRNADVLFLHLNDYDAFKKVLPSKIFEYAATGKPILAGVSGYAAMFIKNEVNNAEVFEPTNAEQALNGLQKLNYTATDRGLFINKYARQTIMEKMASSIFKLIEECK